MIHQTVNTFVFILLTQILINNFSILLMLQDYITQQDFAQREILNNIFVRINNFIFYFLKKVFEKISTTVNDGSPGGSEHFNCFWLYHV